MNSLQLASRRDLDRAWDRFLSGDQTALRSVRPPVRESWLRSRTYGVDPTLSAAPQAPEQIQDTPHQADLSIVGPAIAREFHELAALPSSLASISDHQGRLLCTVTSSRFEDTCRQINACVGSSWGERSVGTDSVGLAFAALRPVRIEPGERYCYAWRDWSSETVPLFDLFTSELVGALSLDSLSSQSWNPNIRRLLAWGKASIEQAIQELRLSDRLHLLEGYCQRESRYPSDALMAVDSAGQIIAVGPHVSTVLGRATSDLLNKRVTDVLGERILEEWKNEEREVQLQVSVAAQPVQLTALPVRRRERCAGRILVFRGPRRTPLAARTRTMWRATYTFDDLVGGSPAIQQALDRAKALATSEFPILLSGESGTGKELLAHAIHNASGRSSGPFVPVNCGAIPEELLGAELFGYAEGAFTGAVRGGSRGKLEVADGGTLFLDEVATMPPRMQVSLLRVLEDGVIVPVGSSQPKSVDIRVIAALNVDPVEAVNQGSLRADLYYRLSAMAIRLPPLRDRQEDIPSLAEPILRKAAFDVTITDEAMKLLVEYRWPGNIRELRNVLMQAASFTVDGTISPHHLPPELCGRIEVADLCAPAGPLERAEKLSILKILEESQGHLSLAAARLGVHRTTLYRKMQRYKIAGPKPTAST